MLLDNILLSPILISIDACLDISLDREHYTFLWLCPSCHDIWLHDHRYILHISNQCFFYVLCLTLNWDLSNTGLASKSHTRHKISITVRKEPWNHQDILTDFSLYVFTQKAKDIETLAKIFLTIYERDRIYLSEEPIQTCLSFGIIRISPSKPHLVYRDFVAYIQGDQGKLLHS